MANNKLIKVSDEFIDIFRNFNVCNQIDKMHQLDKKELYLLLTLILDVFSEDDSVVKFNLEPFRTELLEIFELQDDNPVNSILSELVKETGCNYIETNNLIDYSGNKLPGPLTKEEVRNAKINILGNN